MALIGNLVVNILAKTAQFDKGLKRVSRSLRNFQRRLKPITNLTNRIFTASLRVAKIAAAGIAVATAAIIRHGASFEKTMSRVLALTSATAKQFDELRTTAIKLGQETEFTAKQAAEGMSFFALAGFEVNEIIKSMPATLSLAAAGQIELAAASDIAAKIMAGMGITADELGGTVDILAKAFTTSNTTLSQLGEALSFVGPVARATGVSLEATTAAIQLLSNAGIQAERAGTGLRNILARLTGGTPQATRKLEELGVRTLDAAGNMLPLGNIIDQMNFRLRELGGKAARTGRVMNIFGLRAGPSLSILLQAGGNALREFEEALKDSAGTAARIASIQLDNLAGDFTRLKSVISSVSIAIQSRLGPGLRLIVQRLRELLLDKQIDILDWIDSLVGKVSLWLKSVGGMEGALKKLKNALSVAVTWGKILLGVVVGFKVLGATLSGINALSATYGLLATKLSLAAAATAALLLGLYKLQRQAAGAATAPARMRALGIETGDELTGPGLFASRSEGKGGGSVFKALDRSLNRASADEALKEFEANRGEFVDVKSREARLARQEMIRLLAEIDKKLDNNTYAE